MSLTPCAVGERSSSRVSAVPFASCSRVAAKQVLLLSKSRVPLLDQPCSKSGQWIDSKPGKHISPESSTPMNMAYRHSREHHRLFKIRPASSATAVGRNKSTHNAFKAATPVSLDIEHGIPAPEIPSRRVLHRPCRVYIWFRNDAYNAELVGQGTQICPLVTILE